MSEKVRNVESITRPRAQAELERMAAERLKKFEHSTPEKAQKRIERAESAREQLRKVEQVRPQAEAAPVAEPTFKGVLTKAANYRHTMISLQHRMKPGARRFSKFIHSAPVDAASEVLGKTVLRPSVSLGATTGAVILVGFLYVYARQQGFLLKGSEIWIALIVGGIAGLLLEGMSKGVKRLRNR